MHILKRRGNCVGIVNTYWQISANNILTKSLELIRLKSKSMQYILLYYRSYVTRTGTTFK